MKTLIVAFVALVLLAAPVAAQPPVGPSATSYNSSLVPAYGFDGSLDNPWQAGYPNEGAWSLIYGWADWRAVSSVRVIWFTLPQYPWHFLGTGASIGCSQDGTAWTTLATVPGGAADVTLNVSGTCRWVRLLTGPSVSAMTPAVAEMVITSSPTSPPPGQSPPPPVVCAPVQASAAGGAVAVGSSITRGTYATSSGPLPYTDTLKALRNVPVVNLGVDGNHSAHILARVADVIATGMPLVIYQGGDNDATAGTPTATTMANVDATINALLNAGREVVIAEPLPRNIGDPALLQALRVAQRDYAASKGLRFCPTWPVFEDKANPGKLNPLLTNDGVHYNGLGAFTYGRVISRCLGWGMLGD